MMRWLWVGVLAGGVLAGCQQSKPEALYGGKTVAQWSQALSAPEAPDALGQALADPDPAARIAAAKALGELGAKAVKSVPTLVTMTGKDLDRLARAAASDALAKIGEPAVAELAKALASDNWYVRSQAALTLGKIGPSAKAASPELEKALADTQWPVRLEVVKALANIGSGPEVAQALTDVSHRDSDRDVRIKAAAAAEQVAARAP